jgi:hypothetical protein
MKYLIQIDGTNPKNWREIEAGNPQDAIFAEVKPLIIAGQNPEIAYYALGKPLHPSGAPICVQSYKLTVNRNEPRN